MEGGSLNLLLLYAHVSLPTVTCSTKSCRWGAWDQGLQCLCILVPFGNAQTETYVCCVFGTIIMILTVLLVSLFVFMYMHLSMCGIGVKYCCRNSVIVPNVLDALDIPIYELNNDSWT